MMLQPQQFPPKIARILSAAVTHSLAGHSGDDRQASFQQGTLSNSDCAMISRKAPELIRLLSRLSTRELAALHALYTVAMSDSRVFESEGAHGVRIHTESNDNFEIQRVAASFKVPEKSLREHYQSIGKSIRTAYGSQNEKVHELLERAYFESGFDFEIEEEKIRLMELQARELSGDGYQALLEIIPDINEQDMTPSLIESYVDGPIFWGQLISSESADVRKLLTRIAEQCGGLAIHEMSVAVRASFHLYIQLCYESLDDVKDDPVLAAVLGKCDHDTSGKLQYIRLPADAKSIATELVSRNYLSAVSETPPPLTVKNRLSFYYDSDVAPLDARENLARYFEKNSCTLAELGKLSELDQLKRQLNLSESAGALLISIRLYEKYKKTDAAQALTELRVDQYTFEVDELKALLFSSPAYAQIRDLLIAEGGGLLSLVQSSHNAPAFAEIIRTEWKSPEKIKSSPELAKALNIWVHPTSISDTAQPFLDIRARSLAKKLFELGVFDARIASDELVDDSLPQYRCYPDVVGLSQAESNRMILWGKLNAEPPTGIAEEDVLHLAELSKSVHVPFSVLGRYLSSVDHYRVLLESKDKLIEGLRAAIWRYDGGLQFQFMGEQALEAFSQYVKQRFAQIDDLTDTDTLSELLGISKLYENRKGGVNVSVDRRQWLLAKKLIELGLYSSVCSAEQDLSRRSNVSFLLMPEVVGEQGFQRNLHRVLRALFPDLDSVHRNDASPSVTKAVKSLLGLSASATTQEVASCLVEKGHVSPIIPSQHNLPFHRMSFYFDEKVTAAFAFYNLGIAVKERYPTIDHISEQVFANPICTIKDVRTFVTETIRRGYLSAELPAEQAPGRSNVRYGTTYFFNKEMIGDDLVERNIDSYLSSLPHLDAIRVETKGMRALKNILGVEMWQIAHRAVSKGLISSILPTNYTSPSEQGNYFDPRVVSEQALARNRELRERRLMRSAG